jgi:hypothetical protein
MSAKIVFAILAALCGLAVLAGVTSVDPVKLLAAGLISAAVAVVVP